MLHDYCNFSRQNNKTKSPATTIYLIATTTKIWYHHDKKLPSVLSLIHQLLLSIEKVVENETRTASRTWNDGQPKQSLTKWITTTTTTTTTRNHRRRLLPNLPSLSEFLSVAKVTQVVSRVTLERRFDQEDHHVFALRSERVEGRPVQNPRDFFQAIGEKTKIIRWSHAR